MFLRKKLPLQKIVFLVACLRGLQQVPVLLPTRFVGLAYRGHPAESEADIIAVREGEQESEYLLPVEAKRSEGRTVESKVRLDKVQRISERPIGSADVPTKDIEEMKLGGPVSADVLYSLADTAKRRYRNKSNHRALFVEARPEVR